jgi:hypothetical protein
MNYGDLRTHFQNHLDRDDCSDALADMFIGMGLRRIQRVLRTDLQRNSSEITVDEFWPSYFAYPADALVIYQVEVDGYPLPRITKGQTDDFVGFYIDDFQIKFSPEPAVDAVVKVTYYQAFDTNLADIDTANYIDSMFDASIYAALFFAADYFVDTRKSEWESTMGGIVQEIQIERDVAEMSGGDLVITPYGGGIA